MDNFFKNQLYKWAYDKLKEEPEKFGADGCNSLYMQVYLKEFHNTVLSISTLKTISTLSRIKSEILLQNPDLDTRVKDRPKKKKIIENHSNQNPTKMPDR